MYKESFSTLIEINSIKIQMVKVNESIAEHHKRLRLFQEKITDCVEIITLAQQELSSTKTERLSLENNYSLLEKNLEKATKHLELATNEQQMKACEKEQVTLSSEIESIEEKIFSFMEQEEHLQESIKEKMLEKDGLNSGILEIDEEVKHDIAAENLILEGYQDRITTLESELPTSILSTYQNIIDRFDVPFALIDNNQCSECRIAVPSNVVQQVNTCKSLEFCSSCGRLFLVK